MYGCYQIVIKRLLQTPKARIKPGFFGLSLLLQNPFCKNFLSLASPQSRGICKVAIAIKQEFYCQNAVFSRFFVALCAKKIDPKSRLLLRSILYLRARFFEKIALSCDNSYHSHSTDIKQFWLGIILCRVYVSFDYLMYPYYPAYSTPCYHFVIGVDNRSRCTVDMSSMMPYISYFA